MLGSEPYSVQYGKKILTHDPIEHTYHLGEELLVSTTQTLKSAGYYEPYGYNGEAAARFGSYVHETTALFDAQDLYLEGLDPLVKDRLDGWIKFREEKQFIPDMKWRERPVYDPVYMIAGTPDAAGRIGDSKCILDIKTGQYQNWHRLQITFYHMMLKAHDPGYTEAERWLVYLKEGGKYRAILVEDEVEFLCASIVASEQGKKLYGPGSRSLNKR